MPPYTKQSSLKPHMGTVYILYNCIDFRGLLYLHKDVRHVENYDR